MPAASVGVIDDYVFSLSGKRPIRKILIANNGIAAVKAIRSIRRWSYETFGDEHAILFVAMATPEDVAANAEYVRMADVWTSVPGGSNNRNFANVALISDLAVRFSCDAVWAGWGHASENPALPAALANLGIVFLGPSRESMHALGDKIASTIIAQSAGVPTVSWSGSGLSVDYAKHRSVPPDVYEKACVTDSSHALRVARECGYPLVVKASEGGGGKGIRVVHDESEISRAYRQVSGEVPGSPIFLMRLVQNARHVEVQIVADDYGDAMALYGRDCSVQRRHQKIIEEGPVIAAPLHVWKRLENAAVALAKEVGYVGAGTVEYLYKGDASGGEFFFLELNPRLQVEHPVTEWITGVNLPALQLHIGMGIPLKHFSSIRKFLGLPVLVQHTDGDAGHFSMSSSPLNSPLRQLIQRPSASEVLSDQIEPLKISPVAPQGHVIACRVTAENPDEGFQPTSGVIQELTFRNTPNVWGYFSVGASGGVHEFADSQFGHLFAWGETREASRRCLVLALKELSIRGDIRTTVEYLIKLLEMKAFRENKFDTSWLDSLIADKVVAEKPPTSLAIIIGAVCRAHMDYAKKAESFSKCLERGQLPLLDRSLVSFPVELIYDEVKYSFEVTRSDTSAFRVRLFGDNSTNDEKKSVLTEVRSMADGAKLVLADGRSHVCYLRDESTGLRMSIDGKTCLFPKEYDPTVLTSSVSGKLVRFLKSTDDHVQVGEAYAELEVMKMYLTLPAPESGKIKLVGTEGSSVEAGVIIARLELDDPSKVRKAEIFRGTLPDFAPPQVKGRKAHQIFAATKRSVQLLLRGFDGDVAAPEELMHWLDDVRVCVGEIQETLSSLMGRIPSNLIEECEYELGQMLINAGVTDTANGKSSEQIMAELNEKGSSTLSARETWLKHTSAISVGVNKILQLSSAIEATELVEVSSKYKNGSIFAWTMSSFVDEYLEVEKHFARRTGSTADALFALRDLNKQNLSSVFELAASHVRLKEKNSAMTKLLEILSHPPLSTILADENGQTVDFKAKLHQLGQLPGPEYADVALMARMTLADLNRPQFQQRKDFVGRALNEIVNATDIHREDHVQRLLSMKDSILDVLISFMLPTDQNDISSAIRATAARIHILRSYRAYEVADLNVHPIGLEVSDQSLMLEWKFRFLKNDALTIVNLSSTTEEVYKNKSLTSGLVSFDSADNLASGESTGDTKLETFRHGILAGFCTWSAMESEFDGVLERFASKPELSGSGDVNVLTIVIRWDGTAPTLSQTSSVMGEGNSPTKSLALDTSEAFVSHALSIFCLSKPERRQMALKAGIKTFTFIVAPSRSSESVTYPGFFTFRVKNGFQEDPIYRHIDPPMAFQLELSRLSNFSITRCGYPTRSVHVFYAQDKSTLINGNSTKPVSSALPPLSNGSRIKARAKGSRDGNAPQPHRTEDEENSINSTNSKRKPLGSRERDVDARFFVRAVVRHADVFAASREGPTVSIPEAERTFIDALDAVEMARCDRRLRRTEFNHIFMNVIPPVDIDVDDVETICRRMFQRYASRCWSLRVFAVEIKICASISAKSDALSFIPLRFLLFNPTGHDLKVESYIESFDRETRLAKMMSVAQDNRGSQHGSLVSKPYPIMDRIQRKRVLAQAMETTYVYDFLHIFNKQLQQIWRRYSEDRLLGGFHRHKIPTVLIESTELVVKNDSDEFLDYNQSSRLEAVVRPAGQNDVGVVVWRCKLRTPEYPNGREVIVIANDITFRSGSFGPEEDLLFSEASKYARRHGIPRIYLAANSGARIGVAEEVRERFKVQWIDSDFPSKGFGKLVVNESDLNQVSSSVNIGQKLDNGLIEIKDIIGAENGLGVENLMGSGLLAGETSRAYDEIFTITYVCSRSVGIGAYLVRLGQRVVQKDTSAPIILTGHSALNKVLGHEVYISNDQLGGAKVMYPNGVAHTVVRDDVDGIGEILHWMSYVPKCRGDPSPIIESRDAVDRDVKVRPPSGGQPYDPRTKLISGEYHEEDHKRFRSGLFDKDSWREYLTGWAKTVIVGRARLGGVPTGIIAVETRCVDKLVPADPASPDTQETLVTQAGQVWYPDSAAKTAQAIRDFDREGLPLFILANWRGFSGGMRDMFDEVLKHGSLIVDALRDYSQPVFVYIPPGGELRGGAWVVLDTLINPAMIEMYADQECRGGVLEPEGTVDVKFRQRQLLKTMHRLDKRLNDLDEELLQAKPADGIVSDERKQAILDAIYAREAEVLPVYRSVATSFCDLHDTPERMLRKGAVRKIIVWENARIFFYWRLQRRLAEEKVRRKIQQADQSLSAAEITQFLRKWAADYYYSERGINGQGDVNRDSSEDDNTGDNEMWSFDEDDRWVYQWLEVEESSIDRRIEKMRSNCVCRNVAEAYGQSKEGFLDGIETALRKCDSSSERAQLIGAIETKIGIASSRGTSSSSLGILSRLGKFGWDRDKVGSTDQT